MHLNTEIPKGGGDVYQVISSIDLGVKQIKSLDFLHGAIFLAKKINVFTPYILLNLVVNKFAAYNILFLLTYVLSGAGMFLLARHFVKNDQAAFLAGIIYAFSPFHFYQSVSVHLGTMQQQWAPFFALFLFLFFKEKFKFKHFAGVCVFAFLIAMSEHQMLAFTVLFAVMVAIYEIVVDRSILKNKKFWTYVVCSLALLAVVAFVMFGDMLKVATSDNNFLDAGEGAANKYSIAMLDPIAPPIFHSIWPGASEFLQNIMLGGTNRGSYFVGFSVFGVLIYFAYLLKKKKVAETKERKYRNDLIFWSVSTLLFYVFSLGNSFTVGKFTIYLPYYLVYKFLPFYENIRTTGRMFMFAELGIAMLFAYGFLQLLKKYSQKNILLTIVFSAVILLEFWVAPIGTMVVSYSPLYDQMAKDKEQYRLIEIPGSTSYEFASYAMFTASVHDKTDLNGMPLARKISGEFDMQQNTPVIKQLLYTIPKGNDPDTKGDNDILAAFNYNNSNAVLNYYNVRYITISKLYADKDVIALAQKFIEDHVAYAKKYEDSYLIAYEVKKVAPAGFYAQLDETTSDFYSADFKSDTGKTNREFGDGAGLKIVNMGSAGQKVKITVSVKGPEGMTFSSASNKEQNNVLQLTATEKQYSFDTILAAGNNTIVFAVKNAKGSAVSISTSKKKHQAAIVSQISVIAQ
ncbi:MAG: hypothetical protein PHW24_03580 [Candidatus Moranbacteria bacterium]|nr:hypothetical protein [Candidatus Moranbacteria bacterium]